MNREKVLGWGLQMLEIVLTLQVVEGDDVALTKRFHLCLLPPTHSSSGQLILLHLPALVSREHTPRPTLCTPQEANLCMFRMEANDKPKSGSPMNLFWQLLVQTSLCTVRCWYRWGEPPNIPKGGHAETWWRTLYSWQLGASGPVPLPVSQGKVSCYLLFTLLHSPGFSLHQLEWNFDFTAVARVQNGGTAELC